MTGNYQHWYESSSCVRPLKCQTAQVKDSTVVKSFLNIRIGAKPKGLRGNIRKVIENYRVDIEKERKVNS
jgi:hypothetical protein